MATPLQRRTSDVKPRTAAKGAVKRAGAGTRERGGSPWLGSDAEASPSFLQYQQLERQLARWLPMPEAAVAPATVIGAFLDWAMHLAASPAKQWELAQLALEQWTTATGLEPGIEPDLHPLPQDKRFDDPAWQAEPYRGLARAFLLQQQWWERATTGVPGVSKHHEQMLSFAARQWLDTVAPSNFITTNPVVQQRTASEAGLNLLRGAGHALQDAWHEALDLPPLGAEAFAVGENMAVTPGQVVFRNRLIELIQYTPTTPTVHAEPVLIVPAWIMKYYVLDLTPESSLIKHLVDSGFTVFTISWKNPDAQDRDLGMDDYENLGVRAALQTVRTIVPRQPVHAVGYCLGGTLLAIVAAALGRDGDRLLKTVTLLAAQTDFADPGELALFIDEGQVAYLESLMWRSGYLDKRQMKQTFQMLRSRDLVWSYRLHNQLLGERLPVNAMMAWNADGTRLPYRMHSEYLHGMFLRNALARGEWRSGGVPVNLASIDVPLFNVGALQDHVAPWRSVYKLHRLTQAEQSFVLTAGGHNVGIVNPPGQARSSYRLRRWRGGERLLTPDEWLQDTPEEAGSWWSAWVPWLRRHSSRRAAMPQMGAPRTGLPALGPAPGRYVFER